MRINVKQVIIAGHGALIAGEPEGDTTKVVFAEADAVSVIPLAMAVAMGDELTLEAPDDSIIRVVEKPKDLLA